MHGDCRATGRRTSGSRSRGSLFFTSSLSGPAAASRAFSRRCSSAAATTRRSGSSSSTRTSGPTSSRASRSTQLPTLVVVEGRHGARPARAAARLPPDRGASSLPGFADARHREPAELPAAVARYAPPAGPVGLEHVDETRRDGGGSGARRPTTSKAARAGPTVVQPCAPAITLRTPNSGGSRPLSRRTFQSPSSSPRSSVPRGARARTSPSRRWRPSSSASCPRRRVAVRAEVGRLPRRARERRRRARALVAERAAAAALLPRAAPARRAAAAPLRARRRDRDRPRRRARLRLDADAAAPGREPHPQALRRDPGEVHRLRRAALGRRAGARRPLEERRASCSAGATASGSRPRRRSSTPRRRGSTASRRPGSTASSPSGAARRTCPARARPSSR